MVKRNFLLAATVLLLGACASGPTTSGARRDRNFLSEEEISANPPSDARILIERLRPNWLRGRGASSVIGGGEYPVVYIDDVRNGSIEVLSRISSQTIFSMRFIPGRDAATLYGLNHGAGAIQIKTRR